jgi:DNA-binding YbaB/EbfC family protein
MKARLPQGYSNGGGNMNSVIKKAQKMQEEIAKLQAELEVKEYSASVGGGQVEAVVTGKKEVKSLTIKPEVVDPEDIEMLQDLVISAINEAMRAADADSDERMGQLTGNINIPGI